MLPGAFGVTGLPLAWPVGLCVRGGCLFFENCTVDASILIRDASRFLGGVPLLVVVIVLVLCWLEYQGCVFEVFKGTRWMPWHQEPMKDVGACDMPRGVGNQTLIRGFPNGGTWHPSWGVAAV